MVFTRTPQVFRGEEWNATEDYWDRGNPTEKVGRPGKSGLPWESTGILETRSGDRWRPRHSDDCPGRPWVESERGVVGSGGSEGRESGVGRQREWWEEPLGEWSGVVGV